MDDVICRFNLLPLEMIFEILDFIPIHEKKKARLVCHFWRMMIDSQRSVAFRPKLTNNTSMEYFVKSYRSMDNVIIRNINLIMSKKEFPNFQFPRVKNAELGWKNSEGNIERFLKDGCKYTEALTLAKFSLERISRGAISKTLSEVSWKNLTRFKVMVTTSNYKDERARKHLRNVTTVLKYARIPTLQELHFNFDFRYGFSKNHKLQYQKLFMGLYPFLANHSKTLKILTGRINTTSQCTNAFEIPEIPVDLQQSLASNMKLEQCSLSLCGVRRFESLINPALFGTELKILDIQILPSRDRWDLLVRTITLHFEKNLLIIFEKNGKTLTNVSINIHCQTLLAKCTALESLNLVVKEDIMLCMVVPGEHEDLSKFSGIKLKSLSARFSLQNYLPPELLQIIRQSVGTLEHLDLYRTHAIHLDEGRPISFWLKDCVALKSLKIVHIFKEYIEQNMGGQFPHLTELETFLHPESENQRIVATWITESMENLEMITITGPYMDMEFFLTIFTLPKVKRIIFADSERWTELPPTNVIEEIQEFCAIPEVTFTTVKDGRRIGHKGKMHVITINRSTVVNPVIN